MPEVLLVVLALATAVVSGMAMYSFAVVRYRQLPEAVRAHRDMAVYADLTPWRERLRHVVASLFRPVPLIVAVAIAAALKIMDFPEWQIFSLAGIYALWSAVGSWRLSLSGFDDMWREATGEEPPQSWLRPAIYLILNIVATVSWIAVLAFVGIAAANLVERLV